MAGERRRARLRELLGRAGLRDLDPERIEQAFVHDSAAAERGVPSNERLEFLGDAVLGVIVARWLYERFPGEAEGELHKRKAAIVSDASNARTARRLGFTQSLELGAGERASGGAQRDSILGDAFEALVAAVFLDQGMDAAARFVLEQHVAFVDLQTAMLADAKTRLQELVQARLAGKPVYRERASGPDHSRVFTSTVQVGGDVLGTGTGPSKKAAQQQAAAAALDALQERFGLTNATQED